MKAITGIENEPVFSPIVDDFYSGMQVSVPLFKKQLANSKTIDDIKEVYKQKYNGPIVTYDDSIDQNGLISTATLSNKDSMKISVLGNDERIVLTAVYDNLGKGASGAAVECLNLVTGVDKTKGLDL